MLPSAIVFLQLLLNDRVLLGDEFANRNWNNWINWTIIVVLLALSLVLAAQVIIPSRLTQRDFSIANGLATKSGRKRERVRILGGASA
jgi:hypothetical protein